MFVKIREHALRCALIARFAPHMYHTPILLQDPFHHGARAMFLVSAIITYIVAIWLRMAALPDKVSVIFQFIIRSGSEFEQIDQPHRFGCRITAYIRMWA